MPFHYERNTAALDSLRAYLCRETESLDKQAVAYCKERYGDFWANPTIKHDIHHITSDYLIWNIEFSFKVWREMPWIQHISFDDFCEEILPYRVSNEPLEDWKETWYHKFRPLIDTLDTKDPDEICRHLLGYFNMSDCIFTPDLSVPGIGASTMLQSRLGNCKEQGEFMIYLLRSLGIPSGIDQIVQHANFSSKSHYWNYIHNPAGKRVVESFKLYRRFADIPPYRKYGKIYRLRYALQKESLPVKHKNSYIPPAFSQPLIQDVSSEYFPDTDITINFDHTLIPGEKILYLTIYDGKQWMPTAWSEIEGSSVTFRNIESGVLYQPATFSEKGSIPLSEPFILKSNETALFLKIDSNNFQGMTLTRKYRPNTGAFYLIRTINGRFEGANKPDFSDAVMLHTISDTANMLYVNVPIDHSGKFRYIRYMSSIGGYNDMAELQFRSDAVTLQGAVIGNDISAAKAFDGDPLTYFNAVEPDGAWTGLDFDRPKRIDLIRYLFRNDDNSVRPGDLYELLYLDNGKWISAGQKTADTTFLHYEKVPSQTLYWLRNHTRGKEERPFTYENGKQTFW
jgi:hypothetical protein